MHSLWLEKYCESLPLVWNIWFSVYPVPVPSAVYEPSVYYLIAFSLINSFHSCIFLSCPMHFPIAFPPLHSEDDRVGSSLNYHLERCEVQYTVHFCSGTCSHGFHNAYATKSLQFFKGCPHS